MPDEKKIVWVGSSLEDLRDFPQAARQDAGFQLEQVQFGLDPDEEGIHRVFYVTKFGDAVYVLHCVTKKTQKTEKKDIDLGAKRYSEAKRMYEQWKRERSKS